MQAKLERSYRKANGNTVFVYSIAGSTAELSAFEEAQGEFFITDDTTGKPLWFSTRAYGDTVKVGISAKGSVYADLSEMEAAASLVQQFGGNLGQELARAAAAKLLGGVPANAPAPVAAPTAEPAVEETVQEQADF